MLFLFLFLVGGRGHQARSNVAPSQSLDMVRLSVGWFDESHELQFGHTTNKPCLNFFLIQPLRWLLWLLLLLFGLDSSSSSSSSLWFLFPSCPFPGPGVVFLYIAILSIIIIIVFILVLACCQASFKDHTKGREPVVHVDHPSTLDVEFVQNASIMLGWKHHVCQGGGG